MKAVSNAKESRRASIYDVARLAGVSPATVSRFTRRADAVAPGTRARLTRAVRELQFRPSALARAVAARGRQSIGLVLTRTTRPHAGLVLAELLSGVSLEAAHAGWSVHLTQVAAPAEPGTGGECAGIRSLLARHGDLVDGTLVLDDAAEIPEFARFARTHRVLVINRPSRTLPWVGVDNALGGRLAAAHLLSLGHSRIAILSGHGPSGRARLEGCRDALQDARVRPVAQIDCRFDQEEARIAARRLLESASRPSAFVCGSDWMAAGVLEAARSLGIAVPGALSVVGFDDAILASATTPALTTIRQPLVEVGRAAFQMLRLLLEQHGGRTEPSVVAPLLVPPELIARGSTGPAPGEAAPRQGTRSVPGTETSAHQIDTAARGRRENHQP